MIINWNDQNGQYLEGTDENNRTWKAHHKGSCIIFRLDQVTDLPVTDQELLAIKTNAQLEWNDSLDFYDEQAEAHAQSFSDEM